MREPRILLKELHKMLSDIDIRELSDVYDTEPTFVSVYLSLVDEHAPHFLVKRQRECKKALKFDKELLEIFQENMKKIIDALDKNAFPPHSRSAVLFSCVPKDFFKTYGLSLDVENQLVVDTSPYLRMLACLQEEYEDYATVLLDHNNAKLLIISAMDIIDSKKMHEDIMNKHKKGGWSQARFQRLRKGAIDRFFKETTEQLEKMLEKDNVRRIILAGPGNAKKEFEKQLPQHIKEKVIGLLDEDIDVADKDLMKDSLGLFFEKERKEETEYVNELKAEILKGGLVTYGVEETLESVQEGRAELLLVSMGKKGRGWKCEHCKSIGMGEAVKCNNCGKTIYTVDVVEEMIELAEQMGTTVEFIKDNEFLEELGGVAAFLRF